MKTFIHAITHISVQQPLTTQWFDNPVILSQAYNESIEPCFKEYLNAMQSRRMGKLLKRAIVTAVTALKEASLSEPDAIITGTGLGCIDNTEKFLNAMIDNDESCLQPTFFMQSTHNTISSQIALFLACHGYNSTYSHRGTSFDSSLLDAFIQLQLGQIHNALINGHDEMTPDYFSMLHKIGYWKSEEITEQILRDASTAGSLSGSCSVSMVIADRQTVDTWCSIDYMTMMYQPSVAQIAESLSECLSKNNIQLSDIDAVVMGLSGDAANDAVYKTLISHFFPSTPVLWYKHLFGESFCSSAFGLYVAATILHKQAIPDILFYSPSLSACKPKHLLVYNHFQNKDHSFVLLSSCLD